MNLNMIKAWSWKQTVKWTQIGPHAQKTYIDHVHTWDKSLIIRTLLSHRAKPQCILCPTWFRKYANWEHACVTCFLIAFGASI